MPFAGRITNDGCGAPQAEKGGSGVARRAATPAGVRDHIWNMGALLKDKGTPARLEPARKRGRRREATVPESEPK
jgi:hypothetical protein